MAEPRDVACQEMEHGVVTQTTAVETLALLAPIADTLERVEEMLAHLSVKLDTANGRLSDLDRSQHA